MPITPSTRLARRAVLGAFLIAALVSPRIAAQFEARKPKTVPGVFVFPSGKTFGESRVGGFSIVVETSYVTPGVGYRRLEHATEKWAPRKRMFKNLISTGREPTAIIVEGEVFLCWVERRLTLGGIQSRLYTTTSTKSATTFRAPTRMRPPPSVVSPFLEGYGVVKSSKKRIYVAALWRGIAGWNRKFLLSKSNDNGSTFETPIEIASASVGRRLQQVQIADGSDRVHVAWLQDRGNGSNGQVDVYHRAIPHNSNTPTAARRVSTKAFDPADNGIVLETDQRGMAVAWLASNAAKRDTLLASASIDDGKTFTPPQVVGAYRPGLDDVSNPTLLVDAPNNNASIAWSDDRGLNRKVRVAALDLKSGFVGKEQEVFAIDSDEPLLIRDGGEKILLNALTPLGVRGSFSTDGGKNFEPGFSMLDVPRGKSVEVTAANYDPKTRDFEFAWQVQDTDGLAFGGIRPQSVGLDTATGQFNGGSANRFRVSNFPKNLAGLPFQIILSTSSGSTNLRAIDTVVGLRRDRLFVLSFEIAALRGTLDKNGAGFSGAIHVPYALLGQKFWFAALAIDTNGFIGIVTDPRERVIQDDLLRRR